MLSKSHFFNMNLFIKLTVGCEWLTSVERSVTPPLLFYLTRLSFNFMDIILATNQL